MRAKPRRYDFRAVTEDDLPMIAGWLAKLHVAEWWDDPDKDSIYGPALMMAIDADERTSVA